MYHLLLPSPHFTAPGNGDKNREGKSFSEIIEISFNFFHKTCFLLKISFFLNHKVMSKEKFYD